MLILCICSSYLLENTVLMAKFKYKHIYYGTQTSSQVAHERRGKLNFHHFSPLLNPIALGIPFCSDNPRSISHSCHFALHLQMRRDGGDSVDPAEGVGKLCQQNPAGLLVQGIPPSQFIIVGFKAGALFSPSKHSIRPEEDRHTRF